MNLWYPAAIRDSAFVADGGSWIPGVPFRGVLHTTEALHFTPGQGSYWGNFYWPHFTTELMASGVFAVYQHIGLDRAGRALANQPGGVETNRQCAIQIEICWTAADAPHLPPAMIDGLKKLMRWIEAQTGILPRSPLFQAYPASYGPRRPGGNSVRFDAATWRVFNAWAGHEMVPENVHGDPGLIPINALLAPIPIPVPIPPHLEDILRDLVIYRDAAHHACVTDGRHSHGIEEPLRVALAHGGVTGAPDNDADYAAILALPEWPAP